MRYASLAAVSHQSEAQLVHGPWFDPCGFTVALDVLVSRDTVNLVAAVLQEPKQEPVWTHSLCVRLQSFAGWVRRSLPVLQSGLHEVATSDIAWRQLQALRHPHTVGVGGLKEQTVNRISRCRNRYQLGDFFFREVEHGLSSLA